MQAQLKQEFDLLASGITPGFYNAPVVFERGKGAWLFDTEGKDYIDFCSGTFTNSLGHSNEELVEFMQARISELWNIHDYSTPYKLKLLQNLDALTPEHINKFQFYSGGSETIEAGVRALRSFLPKGKQKMCGFSGGYHGKTRGARSLYHWLFPGEESSESLLLPFPDKFGLKENSRVSFEQECLEEIKEIFEANTDIGAVVFEPIQGAAGNLHASKNFWEEFAALCKQHEILLFADEICVGFGRTGYDFAFQQYQLKPDLIAFSKGLASGFPAMVLGGCQEIMDAKPFGDLGGASTTFGGNPLAVAAMYKTTSIYLRDNLKGRVLELSSDFESCVVDTLAKHPEIAETRINGLMATLKLTQGSEEESRQFALQLHKNCIESGLKVMTFDQHFRIYPPLTIDISTLRKGFARLDSAFAQTREQWLSTEESK